MLQNDPILVREQNRPGSVIIKLCEAQQKDVEDK